MDTNVNNYSIQELLEILEIDDLDAEIIISKSAQIMSDLNNNGKQDVIQFIKDIKFRLLNEINLQNTNDYESETESDEEEYENEDDPEIPQADQWLKSQNLQATSQNEDKITDRNNQIEVSDNSHAEMKKKQLGITQQVNIGISQGVLNPNLKNTLTRVVNIDSQFRQNVLSNNTSNASSDFMIDLNEPITDVLNIKLFSAQIPFTWYVFDDLNNSNIFYINSTEIKITPGNYLLEEISTELNEQINKTIFKDKITAEHNTKNGKITFKMEKQVKNVKFYDNSDVTMRKNNTLGWILGFRQNIYNNENTTQSWTISSEGVADLYGTKYAMIYFDEFNLNRINNNLINLTDEQNIQFKMPSYFERDLSFNIEPDGLLRVIPETNRKNTSAQRYAMNEILLQKHNNKNKDVKINPTNSSDIIGIIPIKKNGFPLGEPIIEFGGSLQANERTYFGPVTIQKLHIKLLNDKGELINLNGCDWSFSLLCETLYQY
jgi:hypothetical protein